MSAPTICLDTAHNLVGTKISPDWEVVEKIQRDQNGTGGHFSVNYLVRNTAGQQAFLKVLDLARALSIPGDQLQNVQNLINQFNFERETLRVCRTYRLKGVAAALQDGRIDIPGNSIGVYYIVFELADGDIRTQLSKLQQVDLPWLLRTLHQISAALFQLHRKGIAHQDVKPSNILIFHERAKIADLGCADIRDQVSPRGGFQIAGDRAYAPPELLYGDISGDWDRRRLGTDMYLFGSLLTFLFTGVSTTAVLISNLSPNHRPRLLAR